MPIRLIGVLEAGAAAGMIASLFLPSLPMFTPLVAVGMALVMSGSMATYLRRSEYLDMVGNLTWLVVAKATHILPITSPVTHHYAAIFVTLQRKGRPIPINDLWIAAIALAYDLIVVSNDAHFQYIDGLQVEDWTI